MSPIPILNPSPIQRLLMVWGFNTLWPPNDVDTFFFCCYYVDTFLFIKSLMLHEWIKMKEVYVNMFDWRVKLLCDGGRRCWEVYYFGIIIEFTWREWNRTCLLFFSFYSRATILGTVAVTFGTPSQIFLLLW